MANRTFPTIAFVLPWYSQDIVGGAEIETRKLAENLQLRGLSVEILATCAKDGSSGWTKDYFKEEKSVEGDLTIRRFRLDRRPLTHFDQLNARLMRGEGITPEQETLFMSESVSSRRLCSFIENNIQSYVFVFIPYLFGTTYWGSKAAAGRSFLIPCLHDEGYARMRLIQEMFRGFNKVLFHTVPELNLARRLYGVPDDQIFLLGEGVDTDVTGNANAFAKAYGICDPFVLYVGRRDEGKNTPLLIDYFCRFKRRNECDLKLVLAGVGQVAVPEPFKGDVIDLGFLPEQKKHDAYAAALVTCQPSVNESFSIVIMESWVQGTPVLVHGKCDVTKDHCLRSNGGLYFTDYWEFEGCLQYFLKNREMGRRMGELGSRYVKANSSWERITKRFVSAVFGD